MCFNETIVDPHRKPDIFRLLPQYIKNIKIVFNSLMILLSMSFFSLPQHRTLCCTGDTDGDGVRETIEDVLIVSCGCSTTPAPERGVTPAPIALTESTFPPVTDSGAGSTSCSEGSSFSIWSGDLPDTEGCYLDTTYTSNDEIIYTPSGTTASGQIWMITSELTGDDGGTTVSTFVNTGLISGRERVDGRLSWYTIIADQGSGRSSSRTFVNHFGPRARGAPRLTRKLSQPFYNCT